MIRSGRPELFTPVYKSGINRASRDAFVPNEAGALRTDYKKA